MAGAARTNDAAGHTKSKNGEKTATGVSAQANPWPAEWSAAMGCARQQRRRISGVLRNRASSSGITSSSIQNMPMFANNLH